MGEDPALTFLAADSDAEAAELFALADSIFKEYKAACNIPDLDTAIYLLYQATRSRLPSHPELCQCIDPLATALFTRFSYTGEFKDIQRSITFRSSAFASVGADHLQDLLASDDIDGSEVEDSSDMISYASMIVGDFHRSIDLSTLDTVILLHRQALSSRQVSDPKRWQSLSELSDALLIRFRATSQIEELEESVSLLRQLHRIQPNRVLKLCAILLAESAESIAPGQMLEALQLFQKGMDSDTEATESAQSGTNLLVVFEASGNPSDLDTAISRLEKAEHQLSWVHPARAGTINNLANAVFDRFEEWGDPTDLDRVIDLHTEALALRRVPHPDRLVSLKQLARCLRKRFAQTGDATDLDRAVELYREALDLRPLPHPDRSTQLANLAIALHARYTHCGDAMDLESAISLQHEALFLRPAPRMGRGSLLSNLGSFLHARFAQRGETADLDAAIELHREALSLEPPMKPGRADSLNNLAIALYSRFQNTGDPMALASAIELHREALSLRPVPHPDRSSSLGNLGVMLHTRFTQRGDPADLDSAVELHREALDLEPAPRPDRSMCLDNLANDLHVRFSDRGDLADLDTAIELRYEALALRPAGHPDGSGSLNNIATGLYMRFTQRGDPNDLDRSIELHHQVLALRPDPHKERNESLNNLSGTLFARFTQRGDPADLDRSIELSREILAMRPGLHPGRGDSLHQLASGLYERFMQRGDVNDLDSSIELHRELLALRPAPHRDRGVSLGDLGGMLHARFTKRGDTMDLDSAIELYRETLSLEPAPHPGRHVSLNNLAIGLYEQFRQTGNQESLDRCIELHREALALRPVPHPQRSSSLGNLGAALYSRFTQTGDVRDVDGAIELHREALALRPHPHPDRSASLFTLAACLQQRFGPIGDPSDLDKARELHREALALRPVTHPERGESFHALALLLMSKHEYSADSRFLDEGVAAFREASTYNYSSLSARFMSSREWSRQADRANHKSALEAYRTAIELLPQLAMLGLDLQSRQKALTSGSNGLASNAAACAIRLQDFRKAIEFLEEGRSVFWSQARQLRTPLDDLRLADPRLARHVSDILQQLELGSHRDLSWSRTLPPHFQEHISVDAEARRYRDLNADWVRLLHDVRQLKGFEDFLCPKPLKKLQNAAIHGPVIILNASKSSSGALIVTFSNVQFVPLPDVTIDSARLLVELLRELPRSTFQVYKFFANHPRGAESTPRSALEARLTGKIVYDLTTPDEAFGLLLAELWRSIVKPVFASLKLNKSDNPPRLWWCPTGPLAFLPIHAAGLYGKDGTDCASDYVVSSYTPSLSALLDPPTHTPAEFKMTALIQPITVDFSPLPATKAELTKIEERVPKQWLTSLGRKTQATVETALLHLRQSSIVHFACHGTQDASNPLDSALILQDGRLKVSQIMRGLEHTQHSSTVSSKTSMSLAFLSACETAKGNDELPDEAMHLAATLLFAGFRGVVATMWTMADSDGPRIANTFYEELFKNCDITSNPPVTPDLTQAARALHLAVAKLRKEPNVPFVRWVPFVHYGL